MIGIVRRRIPTEDKYEFVDLGLPSGLLWAKCNVGAATETDYGLYFSWGETNGYETASAKTYVKNNTTYTGFTWGSYKYITGASAKANALTKYNSSDEKTVLDLEDDAANVNMGGKWRMPTIAEYEELTANTTSVWTTVNGVHGLKLTSKKYTSRYIFFPAAGYCNSTTVSYTEFFGRYWPSSLETSNRLYSRIFDFNSSNVFTSGDFTRFIGLSVRAVRSA